MNIANLKQFSWKWLGIALLGLVAWNIGKNISAPLLTAYFAKWMGLKDYSFAIYSILSALIVFILLFFLYEKVHKEGFNVFGLAKPNLKQDILIGIAVAVVSAIIAFFLVIPLAGEENETVITARNMVEKQNLFTLLVAAIVFGGFLEELFFRGHIITSIRMIAPNNKYLLYFSVLLSIFLFGIAHRYQGILGVSSAGIHSLIYCLLFIKRKSLISPIVAHGLYDTLMIFGLRFL